MKRFVEMITFFILFITWLMGLVLAQGFWQTTFTLFPFYAWYLVVEKALHVIGWV